MTNAREASTHLASLLRSERGYLADFLLALADFDSKALWRELGYPSLFLYLHNGLKLSKGAAHNRKTAAELIKAYPQVESAIRSGALCLTTVTELARVLTPGNAAEVLPRFSGLSRREAEAVAVSLLPPAVIPTREVITLLPPPAPREVTRSAGVRGAQPIVAGVHPVELAFDGEADRSRPVRAAPTNDGGAHPDELPRSPPDAFSLSLAPSPAPDPLQPVPSAGAARLHLTVSAEFLEKLDRHATPSATPSPTAATPRSSSAASTSSSPRPRRSTGSSRSRRRRSGPRSASTSPPT